LILALAAAILSACGDARPTPEPSTLLEGLTRDLLSAAARGEREETLTARARTRHHLLMEEVQTHPDDVLRVALRPEVRASLPAATQAFIETHVTGTGRLERLYQHAKEGPLLLHRVSTEAGPVTVGVSGQSHTLHTGQQVRFNGVSVTPGLVAARGMEVLQADLAPPAVLGEQRTLVILVNFSDDTGQPWTPAQAHSAVFSSADGFIRESSGDRTFLTGQVLGWYTLTLSKHVCDFFEMRRQAQAMAAASGIPLADYQRFIYAFPTNACGFTGMSNVGTAPSSIWANGSLSVRTVAHELNHNFGLLHAHGLECGSASVGGECSSLDYGDPADIMGKPGVVAHPNAAQKFRLGWLPDDALLTLPGGGTVALTPYAAQSGLKSIRIPRGLDPSTGAPLWYYVEYRQPVAADATLATRPGLTGGVLIHQDGMDPAGPASSLIDATPGSSATRDWDDAALVPGQTFADVTIGMTIKTISADGNQAVVEVSTSAPACVRRAPVLVATPQEGTAPAGATVQFQLQLTNRDDAWCTAATFSLAAQAPAGFTWVMSTTSLTLAPGETSAAALSVTSPTGSVVGSNTISIRASGGTAQTTSAIPVSLITVSSGTTNRAPLAVTDWASTAYERAVSVPVLSNDLDPDGNVLTLVSVAGAAHGTVTRSGNVVIYTPARRYSGQDQFTYLVSDGWVTSTGVVNVTVAPRTKGKS